MKKLLILSVMSILIVFLAGCGGKGLWNWNSDGVSGSPVSLVTSISPRILLNKTATLSSTSIRTALNLGAAQVSVVLNDSSATVLPFDSVTEGEKNLIYKPASSVKTSLLALNSAGDKYVFDCRILINGVNFKVKLEVPSMLGGIATDPTTSEITATVTLNTDVYNTVTYSYTVGYIPFGQTTPVAPVSGSIPSGTKNTLPVFYVDKVVWASGTKETILGASEITGIPYDAPVFKVYFNQAIAALPATYSMRVKSTSATFDFDNSTNGLVKMATDTTNKIITIAVDGQGGSSKLQSLTKYQVTFLSGIIENSEHTATASIAPGTTFKIETKK